MIPKSQVTRQLLDLGVQPGGCCWYTALFPGEAGGGWAEGLIAALRSAFRPGGHAGDAQHDRRR